TSDVGRLVSTTEYVAVVAGAASLRVSVVGDTDTEGTSASATGPTASAPRPSYVGSALTAARWTTHCCACTTSSSPGVTRSGWRTDHGGSFAGRLRRTDHVASSKASVAGATEHSPLAVTPTSTRWVGCVARATPTTASGPPSVR